MEGRSFESIRRGVCEHIPWHVVYPPSWSVNFMRAEPFQMLFHTHMPTCTHILAPSKPFGEVGVPVEKFNRI
jgi:hypothetical protein